MEVQFTSLDCLRIALWSVYRSLNQMYTFFPSFPNMLIFSAHFAIFTGEGSSKMHVVLEEKSWRSAQGYCRQNYHDLASVSSQTENQALQQMLNESGPSTTTFWIGLFRDQWTWSDQSNSSFRYWESDQPNHDGECVLFDTFYETLWDRACGSSFPFYCYSGKQQSLDDWFIKQSEFMLEGMYYFWLFNHSSHMEVCREAGTEVRLVLELGWFCYERSHFGPSKFLLSVALS